MDGWRSEGDQKQIRLTRFDYGNEEKAGKKEERNEEEKEERKEGRTFHAPLRISKSSVLS